MTDLPLVASAGRSAAPAIVELAWLDDIPDGHLRDRLLEAWRHDKRNRGLRGLIDGSGPHYHTPDAALLALAAAMMNHGKAPELHGAIAERFDEADFRVAAPHWPPGQGAEAADLRAIWARAESGEKPEAGQRLFGRHAARLTAAGYHPIPISLPGDPTYKDAGKQPAQRKGWTDGCPQQDWPTFAHCGVGLLTRDLPTIDIDTMDQAIGDALQELVDQHIGDAPVRYGQAPKRAMPCRLAGEPFAKLKVTWRAIPGTGDEGRAKPPCVEIQANGQQVVALGVHPGTMQPYRWERDPDLSIPRALLPPLDQATARRFIKVVTRLITDIGGEIIGFAQPETVTVAQLTSRPRWRPETTDQQRVADALDQLGNADLHYDEWIRIGHALKASLGDAGFALFDHWSSKSAKKYDPITTERKWHSFRPYKIGAGAVFAMLKRNGR